MKILARYINLVIGSSSNTRCLVHRAGKNEMETDYWIAQITNLMITRKYIREMDLFIEPVVSGILCLLNKS